MLLVKGKINRLQPTFSIFMEKHKELVSVTIGDFPVHFQSVEKVLKNIIG
jgi:hypothetical protein